MKRQSSDVAPADERVPRPEIARKGLKGFLAATSIILCKIVAAHLFIFGFVTVSVALARQREASTARLVAEQMRAEFGTKLQSEDNEHREHRRPTSTERTQTDPTGDDRSAELQLRVDRLESLVLQLAEKLAATESVPSKSAPSESSSQSEQVNLRLDRIESLLSQQSAEVNHHERSKMSDTHEKTTKTDAAAESTEGPLILLCVLLAGVVAIYCGKAQDAEEAEKRRQIIDAVTERLAMDRRSDSRPLGSENEASSEDDDDASFEDLELTGNEMAR